MVLFEMTAPGRKEAGVALLVGLATILGALGFEHIGGYVPCELCLGQRVPYYAGLPFLAALFIFWAVVPGWARLVATLVLMAVFLWSTYLGAFHSGVEWGFWAGPTACTGLGGDIGFDAMDTLDTIRIVPCDVPQFRFLGISFAGYNALISLAVAALLGLSALSQRKTTTAA